MYIFSGSAVPISRQSHGTSVRFNFIFWTWRWCQIIYCYNKCAAFSTHLTLYHKPNNRSFVANSAAKAWVNKEIKRINWFGWMQIKILQQQQQKAEFLNNIYHSIFMKGSSPNCGIEPSFWVEAFGSGFEVYYSGYLDGFAWVVYRDLEYDRKCCSNLDSDSSLNVLQWRQPIYEVRQSSRVHFSVLLTLWLCELELMEIRYFILFLEQLRTFLNPHFTKLCFLM